MQVMSAASKPAHLSLKLLPLLLFIDDIQVHLATWEQFLQKGLERKYCAKIMKLLCPRDFRSLLGEGPDFSTTPWSELKAAEFCSQGISGLHVHFLILFSKHISDNKKKQDGNEAKKTGQPQEAGSSQAPQHPGPGLNGHYPSQSRGGNLPPPTIAVTRPPGPRVYGVPGYTPGNPRFPGAQPGMSRGPPNYR